MNYLLVHCNQPVRFQVRIPADLLSKSESVLWPVADQSAASSSARGFTRDNCWPNRGGGAVSQGPPVAAERRDWLTLTGSMSTNQLPRLLIPRGSFRFFPRRAFSFQSLWSCVVEGSERCSSCTLRSGARLNYCPLSLHCARSCWRRPCTGIPACTASVFCSFLNVASTNPFSLFPHFPLLGFFPPFFPSASPSFPHVFFPVNLSPFLFVFPFCPPCIDGLSFYSFPCPPHPRVPLLTQYFSYCSYCLFLIFASFIYIFVFSALLHFPPLPQFFLLSFPPHAWNFWWRLLFFFFHLPLPSFLPFHLSQTVLLLSLPPLIFSPLCPPFSLVLLYMMFCH